VKQKVALKDKIIRTQINGKFNDIIIFLYLFPLTANGVLPGGSGTTLKHINNTHHTK
jgi:hypothetical protein